MTTVTIETTIDLGEEHAPRAGEHDIRGDRPLLVATGMTKRFGQVEALVDVDLELYAGEVAIARSLLGKPRIVILDEPTAALGVVQTAQVLELIGRLRDRGLAVVVISHNLANVYHVADRIVVLRLGRLAASFDRRTTPREDVVAAITGAGATAAP